MDDLISRQAAIDALNELMIYRPLDSDRYVISDCLNKIVGLPSADVQPVRHGHWIYTPTSPLGFTCSECGKEMCRFNYCPHCGVRMDEVTQ